MADQILGPIGREPVQFVAAVVAVVAAVGGLAVFLGLASTDDVDSWVQTVSGVLTALVPILSLVLGRFARSRVTPVAKLGLVKGVPLPPPGETITVKAA